MATNGDGSVRREQTSDLQLLVDSAPSLIHTSRPDGYLDFFNQTWLRYVGRSLEDLQGWKWTAFIHPEDVEGTLRLSLPERLAQAKNSSPALSTNDPGALGVPSSV